MDWRHVDARPFSSLFVVEATGDSEADHDATTTIAAEHSSMPCYMDEVAAVDDAESCTDDQSWETMDAHFTLDNNDQWTHGEMDGQRSILEVGEEEEVVMVEEEEEEEEEEEGVVDSCKRARVRERDKEEREEDRLFWERCLAMGFP